MTEDNFCDCDDLQIVYIEEFISVATAQVDDQFKTVMITQVAHVPYWYCPNCERTEQIDPTDLITGAAHFEKWGISIGI